MMQRISVSFQADGNLGPFEERFVVNVDRPDVLPMMIKVGGEVAGSFTVAPSALWLGNTRGLSESTARLLVSCDSGVLRLDGLEIDSSGWRVSHTVGEIKDSPRHIPIDPRIQAPNVTGFLETFPRIKVSRGHEAATLIVPVTASVTATDQKGATDP